MVEQATKELERQAAEAGTDDGVPADHPDLIQLWRYYQRRNPVSSTGDDRAHSKSRHALIKRVAEYLADNGMLRRAGKENGGTYTTTARYQIQVRELAGQQMLGQLAELGITVGPDGRPSFNSPQTDTDPATPCPQPSQETDPAMYELNRIRLYNIGPTGARYGDVLLELSEGGSPIPVSTRSSQRPASCSGAQHRRHCSCWRTAAESPC
ncbi:hypothetical protein [Streptomyces noursei]|uniref:hypothetical protein n=1 Tax=Streptomyces noursei TaxID=1971 RepID=UPI0021A642D4|nr:hypothetical protein [Streptomyces noursei]UWS69822.1 hypothetical protein N1H47_00090 [Streptomyces noursei]UWS76957.1 hypothetical protein N1H47_40430 [Streptomyces noursei]